MVSGKIRLKFKKTGKLKFISHLDLMRTMKGALGRAGVPLKYSEGFNPHPKMVFSLPLPVGAESVCEYLEITLTEECDEKKLLGEINAQLTSDLCVTEIYPVDMDMRTLAGAEYDFRFKDLTAEELRGALEGPLMIEKHSKKGMIIVDLRPKIADFSIESDGTGAKMHAKLGVDGGDFVNPELFVRSIELKTGKPIEYYSILRTSLYVAGQKTFR